MYFFDSAMKFFHPLAARPLQHGTEGACGLAPMEKFLFEKPSGPASCTGRKMTVEAVGSWIFSWKNKFVNFT